MRDAARFRQRRFAAVSRIALAVTLCAGFSLSAVADYPEPPPFFAIENARVVVAPGKVMETATILIADGLIEAVGRGLAIPDDAWVIDGTGLTAYPGLIDAMTDLAQDASDEVPGRGRSGSSEPQIRGPEDRPGTTPWRNAADMLAGEDRRVAEWRAAGFTAAVTAPGGGFFPGQAVLIHLGDDSASERVVASPIAQRIGFRQPGRQFPRSLMGGISYVRQVLSDARHHARAVELYNQAPLGRERPPYDRALAPLSDAVAAGLPFLMPADYGREIDRALGLAREWELRPIIFGARGGYTRIDALRKISAPVLVSLDWPSEDKHGDPEADTSLATLYHQRKAPTTPQLLASAGIPFAFYSDGLAAPSKIFEGVRAAIDAGLEADDALTALTLGAARIFGIDDRLGSIEAGKIANLMLVTAEPWDQDAEVKAVFVDGRKYQERGDDEPREPPTVDVTGTWDLELETPGGLRDINAEFEMTPDGKVTGELTSERGTRTVEKGRVSADELTFKTTQTRGERTFQASYLLTFTEDRTTGSLTAGSTVMELTGERTSSAPPAGADGDDEPLVTMDELERAMALYTGPVRELEAFAITHATVYTVSGETLEDATVVVRGGKIKAVGADVEVPAGVEIIDAAGGSLVPGIIDAHSHIAIEGGVNESTLAVTSMVTVDDVIDPDDVAIYRALAGGVTSVNLLHGSSNPIGGGNSVIKLRWGQDADGLRFQGAPSGIKFALGENPKRSRRTPTPGNPPRYPATRMGVMDVIRQAFYEAREYQKEHERYQQAATAGGAGLAPRIDYKLERLVEILRGERWVHSHCYRADEILQLLRLAEELGFKIATLQHVLEGYKVADEIAAHGAGASTFSDWWGYKVEAFDAIPYNAALMAERGVLVSINSDSGEEMRHLNQEAAKAVKWGGLSETEALALVTLNPARQLGIDDRVGSIEVDKDADLVLYDGHPLSMFSVVQKTFVDGQLYFDREADRARQAAIDGIKDKLQPDAEKDEKENS